MVRIIPFIDLHAHFAMHLDLPPSGDYYTDRRNRTALGIANFAFNYGFSPRVTIPLARAGHVSAFGSVLYDPADEFCKPQSSPHNPFANLQAQRYELEANLRSDSVQIVRTPDELEAVVFAGEKIAVFHCVEGGFALDRNPDNVLRLARLGVAYVILAHLFFRDVSTSANAFPCLTDKSFNKLFPQPDEGLTKVGKDLCAALFDAGIIVDIAHASPAAVDDIFTIQERYPGQPVICSHTGVRDTSSPSYLINVSKETILRIHATGGITGVIFFDHWLRPQGSSESSIALLLRSISCILETTGTDTSVGIGTDLDGFIRPIRGLENYSRIPALQEALEKNHYSRQTIERIMYRNVIDVLKRGWRAPSATLMRNSGSAEL